MNEFVVERIKLARKELNKTQSDLAKVLGKTTGAVSDLERGNVQVTVSDLFKIAEYLNKPIEWFFGFEKENIMLETFLGLIRKTPKEITDIQLPLFTNMLQMQDVTTRMQEIDQENEEDLQKIALEFYGYLIAYLRDAKKMYDEGIKQKEIFEQILGIAPMSIE